MWKLGDLQKQEWTQEKWFRVSHAVQRSNNICAFTPSQDWAGPSHLLTRPHCIPATAAALLPLLTTILSNHSSQPHTQSLTCLGLEVIISLLPGGGKKGKKGNCLENNSPLTLLPLVPIPGAQLWLGLQAFRQALTSCFLGCLWRNTEEV